jgi:gliding motility-associated-like protein
MKFLITLYFALFAVILNAQFVSDSIGCVPLLVKYKSPKEATVNIFWDFGDGSSSDKLNPTHVYAVSGTYLVKLTIDNTLISSKEIKVFTESIINIEYDKTTGCAPLSVSFKNKSSLAPELSNISYLWDFGDGGSSTLADPLYTYFDIGNFDVTLNVLTSITQCNNITTVEKAVIINDKQNIDFTIDSISTCTLPKKVYLSYVGEVNENYKYNWNFGNDIKFDKAIPGPILYSKEGKYTVSLSVDNGSGCESLVTKIVDIKEDKSKFEIYVMADTLCHDINFNINNFSPQGNYMWVFGKGGSIDTSYERVPKKIKFVEAGNQKIFVRQTNLNGCVFDTTINVYVEKVDASIDINDSIFCNLPTEIIFNAKVKDYKFYTWNNKIGTSVFKINKPYIERDSFYYNEEIIDIVRLYAVSKHGCFATTAPPIKLKTKIPNALFEISEVKGSVPFTLKLFDKSEAFDKIIKWTVTWGDGSKTVYDKNTIATASHLYNQPGNYYVNLAIETESGCRDDYYGAWICVTPTIKGVADSNEVFTVGLKDTLVVCTNGPIEINKDSISSIISSYHLDFGRPGSACDLKSIRYSATENPGIYLAYFILKLGNESREIKQYIRVKGAKAKISYKINCVDRLDVKFLNNSLNATKSFWIIDKDTIINKDSLIYTFPSFGAYKIKLYAINDQDSSCGWALDSVEIKLQNPIAKINGLDTYCQSDTIKLFSGNSRDIVVGGKLGYLWKFSDKTIPPVITEREYLEAKLNSGYNDISLEVRDVNGCRDTDYIRINVIGLEADFKLNYDYLCDSLLIELDDLTKHDTTIVSWKWNIDSKLNQPSIKYLFRQAQDTIYKIELKVEDAHGCKSSKINTFKVIKPQMEIIFDSNIVCEGKSLSFKTVNTQPTVTNLKFHWIIDGSSKFIDSNLILKNLSPGLHTVHVTGYDEKTNCKTEKQEFSVSIAAKPKAIISEFADSLFCFPKTIKMSGANSTFDVLDNPKYSWTFGNGRSSTKVNPVETFKKGSFNIRLIARSKFGCNDTAITKIKLVGPEGKMKANRTNVCKGEEITFTLSNKKDVASYYWDFGQGETIENISPVKYSYNFLPPLGKTFATLVLQSLENGCETVLNIPIQIKLVNASFDSLLSCDPSIKLNSTSLGADQFSWIFNDTEFSNGSTADITFPSTGIFKIKLLIVDSLGICKDSVSNNIKILKYPTIDVKNIKICEDQEVEFQVEPGVQYTFEPNEIISKQGEKYFIFIDKDIQLKVKASIDSACIVEKVIPISHFNIDKEEIFDTVLICSENHEIKIQKQAGDVFSWEFLDGLTSSDLSCLECSNPILNQGASGQMILTITNTDNCFERKINYAVYNPKVDVPNVFSPNNDGSNDLFRPVLIPFSQQDKLNIVSMKIFNRWGKEVSNNDKPWNGYIDGYLATEEVYYFTMSYNIAGSCTTTQKGNVTLVR